MERVNHRRTAGSRRERGPDHAGVVVDDVVLPEQPLRDERVPRFEPDAPEQRRIRGVLERRDELSLGLGAARREERDVVTARDETLGEQ